MSEKKQTLFITLPYGILALIMLVMVLSGCKQYEPPHFTENKVQVQEEVFSDTIPVKTMHEGGVEALAQHYRKHGDGPVSLTVTYDPQSKSTGAMKASEEAAKLSKALRAAGVLNVQSEILPVNETGDMMNAMVSYTAYNALAPKDCEVMTGLKTRNVEVQEDYKMGCTTGTLFAQQIARPKDLKGQSGADDTTDGRRGSNIVEVYRTGIPNERLQGESASE